MARAFRDQPSASCSRPPVLRDYAEQVVGLRYAGMVAELFLDGQGFAGPVFRLL